MPIFGLVDTLEKRRNDVFYREIRYMSEMIKYVINEISQSLFPRVCCTFYFIEIEDHHSNAHQKFSISLPQTALIVHESVTKLSDKIFFCHFL